MCESFRLQNRPLEEKARKVLEQSMAHEPIRKKRIRLRNVVADRPYQTYTVADESPLFYIVEPELGRPMAKSKAEWEEVPTRVVWRDVTKEVSDNHGGVLFHGGQMIRLHNDLFQVTIKRRFEVTD